MKTVINFPVHKVVSSLALTVMIGVAVPSVLDINRHAQAAAAALPDFTDLVEKYSPAVVNIRTTEKVNVNRNGQPDFGGDEQMQEFFRRFFGMPMPAPIPKQQPAPKGRKQAPEQEEVNRGIGSGFIISQDGYVLTNAHVVSGADEVYVKLTDKREFKAKVIGVDARTDVAVIKIDGNKLPKVLIGDSDKIRAGEWVIAIGSPFDLENTVTAGIISAKARDTENDLLPLIQTDVAVNPGNSGGPLINMRGEVVGINSQIYSQSGGYMGISFAIPIDEAMRVAEQLKVSGRVTRGRIGVYPDVVTKDIAESIGLAKPTGALVRKVEAGTPAEKAGIKGGDVILKFNGTPIEKPIDLFRIVGTTKPGSVVPVSVWRNGKPLELSVVVAESEDEKITQKNDKKSRQDQGVNALGLNVKDLTDTQKRDLQGLGGVAIESAEGAAARSGLLPGDIIQSVNNVEIKNSKDFNTVVSKLDSKKTVVLLVRRGEYSQFVTIRPVVQ
jgi:serine protease Do